MNKEALSLIKCIIYVLNWIFVLDSRKTAENKTDSLPQGAYTAWLRFHTRPALPEDTGCLWLEGPMWWLLLLDWVSLAWVSEALPYSWVWLEAKTRLIKGQLWHSLGSRSADQDYDWASDCGYSTARTLTRTSETMTDWDRKAVAGGCVSGPGYKMHRLMKVIIHGFKNYIQ